ncbi:BQ5605_C015g07871 [Microbotryum silenes-dioicae]|uniref:Probable RNA polymerase II nuclear localization protein SLC7A6OS n=1 Tax=Microbotryum silenes-dioicae TaxID=796604 RepID=A0A2X0NQS2_9BASI|nr:BQ5605_C015g07871 [Microbotryum silenes-dioicae]
MSPGSAYSILRIKRKRTEQADPLDALVIQDGAQAELPSQLTHKRRRSNTSTPAPGGIFHFAETVPLDTFDSDTSSRKLRERISAFLREPQDSSRGQLPQIGPGSLPSIPSDFRQVEPPTLAATPRKLPTSLERGPTSSNSRTGDLISPTGVESMKPTRYHVIGQTRYEQESDARRRRQLGGGVPPQVVASSSVRSTPDRFRIYEAAPIGEGDELSNQGPRQGRGLRPTTTSSAKAKEDEIMSSFVPMLQEYLNLGDPTSASDSAPAIVLPSLGPGLGPGDAKEGGETEDDEYVYDVYYRDLRSSVMTIDVGSSEGLRRVGQLAGLDDDDDDDLLRAGADDSDQDELGDEDDQDSNEENDYRNDYPDEDGDDDDSDLFDGSDGGDDARW